MAGNTDLVCTISEECSELSRLRKEIYFLKDKIDTLEGNKTRTRCPICSDFMISLPSMNIRQCSNGHKIEWKLKPGQKSLLIQGYRG